MVANKKNRSADRAVRNAFDSFNEITIGIDMEEDWTESLYKGTQSHSLSGGDILLGRELYV